MLEPSKSAPDYEAQEKERQRQIKENGGVTDWGKTAEAFDTLDPRHILGATIIGDPNAKHNFGAGSLVESQDNEAKRVRTERRLAEHFMLDDSSSTMHRLRPLAEEMLDAVAWDESKIDLESARKRLASFGFLPR